MDVFGAMWCNTKDTLLLKKVDHVCSLGCTCVADGANAVKRDNLSRFTLPERLIFSTADQQQERGNEESSSFKS